MFRIIKHNRLKQVPAGSNIFLITAAAIQNTLVNCYGLKVEYSISKFRNAAKFTDQNLRMSVPKVFKYLPPDFSVKYSKALPKRIKLRQIPTELNSKNSFGALIKFDNGEFAFAVNCPRLYLFLEDLNITHINQLKDYTTQEIVYFTYSGYNAGSKRKVEWIIQDVELLNLQDYKHRITITGNNQMRCNICLSDCVAMPYVEQLIDNGMTADQTYSLPYTVEEDYRNKVPKAFTAPRRVKDNKAKKGFGNLDNIDQDTQLQFETSILNSFIHAGDVSFEGEVDDDGSISEEQDHNEMMSELSDNIERILDNYKPGEYLLDEPKDLRELLDNTKGTLNMHAVIDNAYGIVQSKADMQLYSDAQLDLDKFTEVFSMSEEYAADELGLTLEELEEEAGDLVDHLDEEQRLEWNIYNLIEEYMFRDVNTEWLTKNPDAVEIIAELIVDQRFWDAYEHIIERFGGFKTIKNQMDKLLANTSVYMAVPQQSFVDMLMDSQGEIIAGAVSASMASDSGYALERYATEILKLNSNERNYLTFHTYGYLSSKNYPAPAYTLTYGDIQFEFHDYVKDNSTVCLGDSFHGFNPVSPVNKINPEYILSAIIGNSKMAEFPSQEMDDTDFAAQFIVNLSHVITFLYNLFNSDPAVGLDYIALFKGIERDATTVSYFESQIKGELSIEDVKTIYIPESSVGQIYHITQKLKATAKYREKGQMPNFRIHNDSHMVMDKTKLTELNDRVQK